LQENKNVLNVNRLKHEELTIFLFYLKSGICTVTSTCSRIHSKPDLSEHQWKSSFCHDGICCFQHL